LSDAEALSLMFHSGVSTSPLITEISGRGLGMAIVREKAERLGGHVAVHSEAGCGTTFRIVLPTTLATCRGILVEVAGQVLVIPVVYVERVGRVAPADIKTVMNRETIAWHGRAMALVRMAEVLELPRDARRPAAPACWPVTVLGAGEERMAFAVDAVLHEEEVLVKRLSRPLVRVRNVAGVTVLGSGRVVPILNVADLLKSAVRAGDTAPAGGAPPRPPDDARRKAVLVVEDSITARMLVKNILESAGYRVQTAVDGQEAWTALHTAPFDAVVSDIEMPRMNGFELTAKIRGEKKLADLPVVLVTALASREDRERGVEAGANAYIVKSNFEQSKLLEILGRMV
jgi:two-component system chemotaxis sensor kinase CheA